MEPVAIAYSFVAFFLAALSKGVTGLGFSTLCLPLLALILDSSTSIPLVIIPSLCSNILVIWGAGKVGPAVKRFWPLYLAVLPGIGIGLWLLIVVENWIGQGILGVVLIGYSGWAWFYQTGKKALVLKGAIAHRLILPVGLLTGIISGLTGSQIMPILPYLLALDLKRDELVTALNLSFTLASIVMLIGLGRIGLIPVSLLGNALCGGLFVALGISLGNRIRQHLKPDRYKQLVLILLVILGVSLLTRFLAAVTSMAL